MKKIRKVAATPSIAGDIPNYVSAQEWSEIKAARRRRFLVLVTALAIGGIALVGLTVFIPSIRKTAHLNSLAAVMNSDRHYHSIVWRFDPKGAQTKLREDFVDGDRWRVDYGDGAATYIHNGGDWLWDRTSHVLVRMSAWKSALAPMARLGEAFQSFLKQGGMDEVKERSGADGSHLDFSTVDTSFHVAMNDNGLPAAYDIDRFIYSGWFRSLRSQFDYKAIDPAIFDPATLSAGQLPAPSSPKVVDFQIGEQRCRLLSADRSSDGTLFLRFQIPLEPKVSARDGEGRSYLARFLFRKDYSLDGPERLLIVESPSENDPAPEKVSLHFERMEGDQTSFGDLNVMVRGTTCGLMPPYLAARLPGENPLFETKVKECEMRAGYWNYLLHEPGGYPAAGTAATTSAASFNPRDRVTGLDYEIEAVLYAMDEGEINARNVAFFEDRWHQVYALLLYRRRAPEAKNVLETLYHLIQQFPKSYDAKRFLTLQWELAQAGLPAMPSSWSPP